jgi:hypothetical protein
LLAETPKLARETKKVAPPERFPAMATTPKARDAKKAAAAIENAISAGEAP